MQRFWDRVTKTSACWVWTGKLDNGYGRFRLNGKVEMAHRVGYLLQNGELNPGLVVDHICFNRACVRGSHLRQISLEENAGRHKPSCTCSGCNVTYKVRCQQGHDLTSGNSRNKQGKCRLCQNEYNRIWMKKNRASKRVAGA